MSTLQPPRFVMCIVFGGAWGTQNERRTGLIVRRNIFIACIPQRLYISTSEVSTYQLLVMLWRYVCSKQSRKLAFGGGKRADFRFQTPKLEQDQQLVNMMMVCRPQSSISYEYHELKCPACLVVYNAQRGGASGFVSGRRGDEHGPHRRSGLHSLQ